MRPLVLGALVAMCACSASGELAYPEALVGNWDSSPSPRLAWATFRSDGSWCAQVGRQLLRREVSGTYWARGHMLTLVNQGMSCSVSLDLSTDGQTLTIGDSACSPLQGQFVRSPTSDDACP
jgi:hypothetical protein